MTTKENTRETLPPYPPNSAWRQLLEGLGSDVPARIDRSYLKLHRFNQSTVSMLQNALRFLGLIDDQDVPTQELHTLLNSQGEEHKTLLRDLLRQSYGPLLTNIDLSTITPDLLQERFRLLGARGDVARKCGSFFVALARDAGLRISPHLRLRRRQPGGQAAPQRAAKPATSGRSQRRVAQQTAETVTNNRDADSSVVGLVLEKFPSFDPSWDQETVERWRDSMAMLVETALHGASSPQPGR